MVDYEEDNKSTEEAKKSEDKTWEAFMAFDYTKMGRMATSDLKNALEFMGDTVTEDETFLLISEVDPENTGEI